MEAIEKQALVAMISEPAKGRLRDALRNNLRGALFCTRVWDAWSVGTMSENDFVDVTEDDNFIEGTVNEILLALMNKE
jgi:hypothetical protein